MVRAKLTRCPYCASVGLVSLLSADTARLASHHQALACVHVCHVMGHEGFLAATERCSVDDARLGTTASASNQVDEEDGEYEPLWRSYGDFSAPSINNAQAWIAIHACMRREDDDLSTVVCVRAPALCMYPYLHSALTV